MQQLVLTRPGEVGWQEVADPELEDDGDVIVRPLAVAACDIDHPMIQGVIEPPMPIALGHEFVAQVTSTGSEVQDFSTGDTVVVPFQVSCGRCDRCQAHQPQGCRAVPTPSMYGFGQVGGDWGGALSDAVRVPFADQMLLALPDGVDPVEVASAGDNIADAWRTVAIPLRERPAAPVLIFGGDFPSIGLYAVQIAKALGSEGVTYLDSSPERLAVAERLGADAVEGRFDRYRRHPIVVDASGSKPGLASALRSVEPGGVCTTVSVFFEDQTPLPLAELYPYGVQLRTGMAQPRVALPEVLDLVAGGHIRPGQVTSRVVGWDEAPAALLEPEIKLVVSRA